MPIPEQILPVVDLTAEDMEALPAAVREKIADAAKGRGGTPGSWVIVGAHTGREAKLLSKTVKALPRIFTGRRRVLTEGTIERLVDVFLEGEERAKVDEDLILDNAALRADYLRQTPTLTAAEIRRLSGLTPKNPSEPASRWKREGRVFAVRRSSADLFPAFQFADGAPLPAVRAILSALPEDMTPWQTAFWFASGNGWLGGAAPQECLASGEDVVRAASRLGEPAVG
ncbi:MAG: hypothetical protein MI755_13380 [Sphingomonadales bacterium]|nr:hypothetical protein [Sphingomonadales bacterium]